MIEGIESEINYRTGRSSGSGGQHVNKVETRVELLFNIPDSKVLTDAEKATLLKKLKNRVSKEGMLSISCMETRSQWRNKQIVFDRFMELVISSFKKTKKRKATKPTRSSKERRLKEKKERSEKKDLRKNIDE